MADENPRPDELLGAPFDPRTQSSTFLGEPTYSAPIHDPRLGDVVASSILPLGDWGSFDMRTGTLSMACDLGGPVDPGEWEQACLGRELGREQNEMAMQDAVLRMAEHWAQKREESRARSMAWKAEMEHRARRLAASNSFIADTASPSGSRSHDLRS